MKGNYTRVLYQLDENLSVINVFRNVAEAVRTLGISKGQVYNVLNGRQYQTHGYVFMWEDEYNRFVDEEDEFNPLNYSDFTWVNDYEHDTQDCQLVITLKDGGCMCLPVTLIDEVSVPHCGYIEEDR